jgi:hypothetical protein
MISADTAYYPHFWNILTRLGEAEILLPVAALTGIALFAREKTRRLALSWMTLIVIAALVTIASKVAFIGWGLGWAEINFTGVSGHAMFAAAIYPILLVTFVSGDRQGSRLISLALGCGLAVLIGVSRIKVGAHSPSEVLAGLIVGGAASATALAISETSVVSIKPVLLAILLVWAAVTPFELNASQTHSLVTRFALRMSGRATPFTRGDLIGSGRHQNSRPAFVAADMGAILTIPDAHVSNTAFQEPARP